MKNTVGPFVKVVNDAIRKKKQPPSIQQPASPGLDIASQIEKLADLHDRGILSEEEFTAQKQKLLSQ